MEASFVEKLKYTVVSKLGNKKAVTAGDGANDVFVSVEVDSGTVTGVGMDAVTEIVDATSADSNLKDAPITTISLKVIHCKTAENSTRVAGHNATVTLPVVGAPVN